MNGKEKNWKELNQELTQAATDNNWASYRCTKFDMAQFLENENKILNALEYYAEVLYLDVNGPQNMPCIIGDVIGINRESFLKFNPENAFVAPAIIESIRILSEKENIQENEFEKLFYRVNENLYRTIQPPINPKTAWQKILYKKSLADQKAKLDRHYTTYNSSEVNTFCDKNPHILRWWTPSYDKLLTQQIKKYQWFWDYDIWPKIIEITPKEIIENWEKTDPLYLMSQRTDIVDTIIYREKGKWDHRSNIDNCARGGVLRNFAMSRAENLNLTKLIRKPKWHVCPLCGQKFIEDSLPIYYVKMLGINQLDFCRPCLDGVLNEGHHSLSMQETIAYLRDLTNVLQRIPSQNFGTRMLGGEIPVLWGLNTKERLEVFKILKRKPAAESVKKMFGSWFEALIEAGILEDGARRTSRGTQCLAVDGHVCFSLGEKTIDDLIHSLGIEHEKEPQYPESNLRADFIINNIFVEYFGLAGNIDYDNKTKLKQELCKKHGIKLISIYPWDLVSSKKLESILSDGLS